MRIVVCEEKLNFINLYEENMKLREQVDVMMLSIKAKDADKSVFAFSKNRQGEGATIVRKTTGLPAYLMYLLVVGQESI